jgi:hypothetical protein
LTSEDDSDDEDGIKLDRYLKIGKDDMIFANSMRRRKMTREEATMNMNNILTLFTNLSVINTKIMISIVANPIKNLKKSIHIIHNKTPLHLIPHFHLDHFEHDIKFDLFIFLPALYNKNMKRRKNNLFNHVSEELRAEFMNKYLLSTIQDILTSNKKQSWDFSYMLYQTKSNTVGLKRVQYKSERESLRQYMLFNLDNKNIETI